MSGRPSLVDASLDDADTGAAQRIDANARRSGHRVYQTRRKCLLPSTAPTRIRCSNMANHQDETATLPTPKKST
jgi:hypothetical protein